MAEIEPEKERRRSPSYPSISLKAAVEKIKILYQADKGAATASEVLAKHWETTAKSSSFLQAVSSLKQYGLLVDIEGPPKRIKLSREALDIVMLPESDPKHLAALKKAALAPKLFSGLWNLHGTELPSEDTLKHELVTAQSFLDEAAADAIKQYKKNIEFAKLGNSDKISEKDSGALISVGDLVQWESQGIAQFTEPRRVTGKADDGEWIFVEGSATGIPETEVRRVEVPKEKKADPMTSTQNQPQPPASTPPPNPNFKPPGPSSGFRQATLPGAGGDIVVRWPMVVSAKEYKIIDQWLEMLKGMIKSDVDDGTAQV